MKFRGIGDITEKIHIAGSIAIVDTFHRRRVGMTPVTGGAVVENLEEAIAVARESDQRNYTVVDTRPEYIADILKRLLALGIEDGTEIAIGILTRKDASAAIVTYLRRIEWMDRLAITGLHVTEDHVHLSLGSSSKSDRPATDFFAGAELGQHANLLCEVKENESADDRVRELRRRLLSILEYGDKVTADLSIEETEEDFAEERRRSSELIASLEQQLDSSAKDLKELASRKVEVDKANEKLKQRYDALAKSKLGRITLRYWKRKGGEG